MVFNLPPAARHWHHLADSDIGSHQVLSILSLTSGWDLGAPRVLPWRAHYAKVFQLIGSEQVLIAGIYHVALGGSNKSVFTTFPLFTAILYCRCYARDIFPTRMHRQRFLWSTLRSCSHRAPILGIFLPCCSFTVWLYLLMAPLPILLRCRSDPWMVYPFNLCPWYYLLGLCANALNTWEVMSCASRFPFTILKRGVTSYAPLVPLCVSYTAQYSLYLY